MFVAEGPNFLAVYGQSANQLALLQQRDKQNGSYPAKFDGIHQTLTAPLYVPAFSSKIGHVDHFFCGDHAGKGAVGSGRRTKGYARAAFSEGGWCIMGRDRVQRLAVPPKDVAKLSLAEADRVLQHGLEDRLKITQRTADNLESLRSRRLPLQRFVQFTRKPSNLRLLGSRGRLGTSWGLRCIAALRLRWLATPAFISSPPTLERLFIASPLG